MEQNKTFDIPTYIIVLSFIFCWPAGIVLLILKSRKKIEAESKISRLQRKQQRYQNIAIIFLIITLFLVSIFIFDEDVVDVSENFGYIFGCSAIFGIPAYVFYQKSKNLKIKIDELMTYDDLVMIRNITSIKKLSEKLNVSEEKVLKFVSEMIRQNQLDAYIKDEKEIILKNVNRRTESVQCKNCGAENPYIEGRENICEYCGSILRL